MFSGLKEDMSLLEALFIELTTLSDMVTVHSELSEKYYHETCKITLDKAVKSQKVLQNQIFSQSLMENLINDLLDLAKLENNSFQLSKDYFNLGNSIYEAFQILISSANQNNIELVAEID